SGFRRWAVALAACLGVLTSPLPAPVLSSSCFCFCSCSCSWSSSCAVAAPLDEPFVGGVGFNGPTAANLGAVYWNPAALGLVRGFQIMVGGTMHLSRISVNRTGVGDTGQPNLALPPMATATARDLSQPFQWPPGPGSFFGISTDLGGDRFTLAFATYEPFLEQVHFT